MNSKSIFLFQGIIVRAMPDPERKRVQKTTIPHEVWYLLKTVPGVSAHREICENTQNCTGFQNMHSFFWDASIWQDGRQNTAKKGVVNYRFSTVVEKNVRTKNRFRDDRYKRFCREFSAASFETIPDAK